uniref:Integrator complex subunit 14 n=1 Tax=Anopheles atroparvus TaxID=41427 RepID=A0A240PJY4_ANOAO
MPTVIALDVSLSMTRPIPHQPKTGGAGDGSSENSLTYHLVAVKGVNYILDYLTKHARLEFVSLIVYSSLYEVLVDFTRDYDSIRQALHKIEHYDKTSLENVLVAVNNAFKSHWGSQNYCQIVFITDCGVGMGPSSLKNTIINIQNYKAACAAAVAAATAEGVKDATGGVAAAVLPQPSDNQWVGFAYPSKLSFVCLGSLATDSAFRCGTKLYQQLLDASGQKGQLFVPRLRPDEPVPSVDESVSPADNGCDDAIAGAFRSQLTKASAMEAFETMCETNYRQFEATLRCGGYFRLEEPVIVWPAPLPYTARDVLGGETTKLMSRRLEVCGFVSLSDIGSPMSVSRHLILPRSPGSSTSTAQHTGEDGKVIKGNSLPSVEERLEADIKAFYAKSDSDPAQHHHHHQHNDEHGAGLEESVCVLLHGALKVENMAALVLLGDAWYGFIYSYADGKKKWNLMLNVLPPGNDVVPWLGDLRYLGTLEDALPGENPAFPIKAEKRSYSQNIVVWIRQAGLQSDIQKVLRHAKKLPEKTQHFYKELNRIRRAALSLGFVELLEGLAHIFEREIGTLPLSASPDCSMQLNHAAMELRKPANRDLKIVIHALPTQYNQLG